MTPRSCKPIDEQVIVVTGGSGILGSNMAGALASAGARVAILGRSRDKTERVAQTLSDSTGGTVRGWAGDVQDRKSLETVREAIAALWGPVDGLINAAGGNRPGATTNKERLEEGDDLDQGFFGMDIEAFRQTVDLNLTGTVLPSMVFGRAMVEKGEGAIINIASITSFRMLTKVAAYGAAKAAVKHLTEWLAVHLGGTGVRVNAIAPGVFLTEQNRFLLMDESTGKPTERGQRILDHTPMGRLGHPDELNGMALYLLTDASRYMTGATLPIDGGFLAYGGV